MLVKEIYNEARKIFGHCDQPILLRWISDSVLMLADKGETDLLMGYLDLCVDGNCVTLPREIETILAVNVCGQPMISRDALFSFHINGPGDGCSCSWTWADQGNWFTYKDIQCPSKLIAFLESPEDQGKMLRVFGFDDQNRPLQTKIGTVWEEGLRVPMIFGFALPSSSDPYVSRITGIVKDITVANVRLSSFDNAANTTGGTGTLLGIFEPDETEPRYRRIKLGHCGGWVRICYRRKSYELRSLEDRIFLTSRLALLMAMRATKAYGDGDVQNGNAYEANATRMLTERENSLTGPARSPIMVDDRNSQFDKYDFID